MRIPIAEDEPKAAAYLAKGLTENAFVVDVASKGDDGLPQSRNGVDDLIVLDVMLLGLDG